MKTSDKIFVAGHRGLVGSAILRSLNARGYDRIITRTRSELDLRDPVATKNFFTLEEPDVIFLAAAKVGGIKANMSAPADFLYDNLMIQCNILREATDRKIKKVIFLGSSCIYPRECQQPMREEYLLTGPLEPTNEGYALAKIAGLRLAQYFGSQNGLDTLSPMPCNLYGPGDHFDLERSHVLSALVKRFVDATDAQQPEVTMWGTGNARREFLHVDDLTEALFLLIEKWHSSEIINVGCGSDYSIRELAEIISRIVGYRGRMSWDTSKPDGMMRKCLDVSRISTLGFRPKITIEEGIQQLVNEYRAFKNSK